MKLRIRADSLRLRLTRGELERLRDAGRVAQTIHFGDSELVYALELGELAQPRARFERSEITVTLPRADALAWIGGDTVGIAATQALPEGELALLIEKDFQCLAPRGEQDADAFPHPKASSGESC